MSHDWEESRTLLPGKGLLWTQLRFEAVAESVLVFSHQPGVTLRGAFGLALKHITCACGAGADGHRATCAFGYLFETPIKPGTLRGTDSSTAPHPFVFGTDALPAGMALQPSQAFRFDLSLFGRGCRYVPYCVLALQRVGSVGFGKGKGRFVLTAVLQRQGTRWHSIFDPRTGLLSARKPQEGLPMGSPLPSDRWEIRTLTPLHLQKDGSPVKHPEFGDFVLAICRRLNHLSAAHQEGRVQVDPRPFMERCRGIRWKETEYRWVVTQRYSARQDRHMPLEGVLATYCAEGDLEPFADLFRLGEVMNIGKHTAFGFGQIAVAPGGIE